MYEESETDALCRLQWLINGYFFENAYKKKKNKEKKMLTKEQLDTLECLDDGEYDALFRKGNDQE
jgi:hypothetical protein